LAAWSRPGAVDVPGVLEEQGDDGRVDVGLHHQVGGGGQQLDVAGRLVAADVDGAAGQGDLDEVGKVAHVAVGLGKVEQADALGVEEGVHHRRLGRADHEERLHVAALEGVHRVHAADATRRGSSVAKPLAARSCRQRAGRRCPPPTAMRRP
jgi:hypothetical protein